MNGVREKVIQNAKFIISSPSVLDPLIMLCFCQDGLFLFCPHTTIIVSDLTYIDKDLYTQAQREEVGTHYRESSRTAQPPHSNWSSIAKCGH